MERALLTVAILGLGAVVLATALLGIGLAIGAIVGRRCPHCGGLLVWAASHWPNRWSVPGDLPASLWLCWRRRKRVRSA